MNLLPSVIAQTRAGEPRCGNPPGKGLRAHRPVGVKGEGDGRPRLARQHAGDLRTRQWPAPARPDPRRRLRRGRRGAEAPKDADVDVVLVDQHDYHTFQPLLYQVATDLLETTAVGHPLRDLFHDQPNVTVHQATVDRDRPRDAQRCSSRRCRALTYDYLVLALGAEVNFFGVKGAAEHAFPLYTLADAVRLTEHVLRPLGGGRPGSVARRRRRAERRRRRRRADRGRERRRAGRALPRRTSRRTIPTVPQEQARLILVEAGPALLLDVQGRHPRLHAEGAREARRRGDARRDRGVGRADPRRRSSRATVLKAHTLVWGAGLQASPIADVARPRAPEGQPHPGRAGPHGHRASRGARRSATSPGSPTRRPGTVLPQLGSVALQAGEQAGENIARRLAGQGRRSRSSTTTRARWRRSAAAPAVDPVARRPDDEGQGGLARLGRRPSRAALHRRGPGEGGRRLDLGGIHARAARPHLVDTAEDDPRAHAARRQSAGDTTTTQDRRRP